MDERAAERRGIMAVLVVSAACSACSANDDISAPRIAAVSPDHGAPGSSVTITGDFFCQQNENEDPLACLQIGSVQFGAVGASLIEYTDAEIIAEVPPAFGDVRVTVSAAGRTSNGYRFVIE
jgi:hypothetical protein